MDGNDREPRNHPIIRLEQRDVANLLIVVQCPSRIFRYRFRIAMALMRFAGRIGGFKSVKVVRDKS